MARYSRAMSPLERLSRAVHAAHSYQVSALVEGRGRVDARELRAAVAVAAAANPGVRLRARRGLGWSRWVDSGVPPEVHVLPDLAWDGNSEQGGSFLLDQSDPAGRGPVSDVLLIGNNRLVFRARHAALDGVGLTHWIVEVFRALRGVPLEGSSSRINDDDVRRQWRDKISNEPPTVQPALAILPHGASRGLHHVWRRVVLPRLMPNVMIKSALFLTKWANRREAGKTSFRIPIDFRGLRTSEQSTGNLIGYIALDVTSDDTERSLKKQLLSHIRQGVDCRPLPGERMLQWAPLHVLRKRIGASMERGMHSDYSPSAGLVSMGMLPLAEGITSTFEATLVSPMSPPVGRLNVIFAEFQHATVVNFSAPGSYNDAGQLDELVEAYRAHFAA